MVQHVIDRRARTSAKLKSVVAVGTSILTVLAAVTGTGTAGASPAPGILAPEYELLAGKAGTLRTALESPSYADTVQAIAAAGEAGGVAVPALPAPTEAQLHTVHPLPSELRAPVAGLLAAVERADEIVGPLPLERMARFQRRVDAHAKLAAPAGHPRIPRRPSPRSLLRYYEKLEHRETARAERPQLELPGFVTRLAERSRAAALLVATAIDAYVPAIDAAKAVLPSSGTAGACDSLNAAPALCVGSGAANSQDKNASLLIDVGGDDTYSGSAGGTFAEAGSGPVSISVGIDLGGNDRYSADPKIASGPPRDVGDRLEGAARPARMFAQGAAYGGVGLLVDAAGNDQYQLDAPAETVEQPRVTVAGQGAATYGGFGALIDQAGADRYAMAAKTQTVVKFIGQGGSESGGTGGLVDRGASNDAYSVSGGSVLQTIDDPDVVSQRTLLVQGATGLGNGILADDGGEDSFAAEVRAETRPSIDDYQRVARPSLRVAAQGATDGVGAKAFLLTGSGPTKYDVSVETLGPTSTGVSAQGTGYGADAYATLDDAGGNDVYALESSLGLHRSFVQTDACLCDGAEAVVDTLAPFGFNSLVRGQGVGDVGGQGVLTDSGGDDRYLATQTAAYSFRLEDRLSRPKLPPLLRAWIPGTQLLAQGMAGISNFGALVDRGTGTDRYEARNVVSSDVSAISRKWKKSPADVRAFVSPGGVRAQGDVLGNSLLVDEGGTGDVVVVEALANSVTSPDPNGSYEFGENLWPSVHDGVYAAGKDASVIATSSVPSCGDPGFHGFGVWQPCSGDSDDPDHQIFRSASGTGYAPLAVGEKPALELLPGTPEVVTSDPHGTARLPVSARLVDPSGKPMARVPLHFDLLFGGVQETPAGGAGPIIWRSAYQETVLTNRKGIAKAQLPLLLLLASGDDLVPDAKQHFTVQATFDGARGLYPRHAMQPVTIRPAGPNKSALRRYVF